MRSGAKVYTVAPDAMGWTATLNERAVFSAASKAQVVSLARHAAQSNAPSTVFVRDADGEIEQEWSFTYEQPAKRLSPLPATA
jgi:hypothetical protein